MTDIGSNNDRAEDESAGEGRFHFRDRRRVDPETGKLRDTGGGSDASAAAADAAAAEAAGAAAGSGSSDAASEELAAARAEAAERTADLQRVSAEYANYRKRTDREKEQATATGKAKVASELLTVLDDLDRAEEHGDLTGGFKNVADKITGTLQRLGLSHFGAEGDEFDPNVHEAVQFATSSEVQQPTVTTVLRAGYTFGERVLRPAIVMVTGPEHEAADGADGVGERGTRDEAAESRDHAEEIGEAAPEGSAGSGAAGADVTDADATGGVADDGMTGDGVPGDGIADSDVQTETVADGGPSNQ